MHAAVSSTLIRAAVPVRRRLRLFTPTGNGEQLATGADLDIRRELNLDAFRAEFMGRNHGVPCEFLCYPVPGKWSYDDAIALTLLHDVLVRPCGFGNADHFASLWKVLDDFGIGESEWLPYWERPLEVCPDSVKASVYRRKGMCLAVISNLSPTAAVQAEVTLPADVTSVTEALSGSELPLRSGKVVVVLEPFRMKLLKYTLF